MDAAGVLMARSLSQYSSSVDPNYYHLSHGSVNMRKINKRLCVIRCYRMGSSDQTIRFVAFSTLSSLS